MLSVRGVSPEAMLDAPKYRRAATPMPPPTTLKILFPTWDWVRGSVLGEAGAGTMFCRKSTWEATEFPRHLLCKSQSRHGRVLMHTKVSCALDRPGILLICLSDPDDDRKFCWCRLVR